MDDGWKGDKWMGSKQQALSRTEQAYLTIREAIYTGRLQPGTRLAEEPLARDYGMSRTPVREALKRLEVEGLVEFVYHRGMVVSSPSLDELSDLCVVREMLEGLAARLAANSRTEVELMTLEGLAGAMEEVVKTDETTKLVDLNHQFHSLIWQASRNRYLAEQLAQLRRMISRLQQTTFTYPGRKKQIIQEHRQLLDAIGKREVERAERVTKEHFAHAEVIRMMMREGNVSEIDE